MQLGKNIESLVEGFYCLQLEKNGMKVVCEFKGHTFFFCSGKQATPEEILVKYPYTEVVLINLNDYIPGNQNISMLDGSSYPLPVC